MSNCLRLQKVVNNNKTSKTPLNHPLFLLYEIITKFGNYILQPVTILFHKQIKLPFQECK